MPEKSMFSGRRTAQSQIVGMLLASGAIALTLGVFLGALILINRFWPASAITAEEVLNYVLVAAIAGIGLPWIQHRSFRHQRGLYFGSPGALPAGQEAPARPPLTVLAARLALLLAGAALLVLAFGPLSRLDRLAGWLQDSGLGTLSLRLVEWLIVLGLAGCFLLASGLSALYQRLGLAKRRQLTGDPRQEAQRIWLICFTGSFALAGGLCLVAGFLIRRFL